MLVLRHPKIKLVLVYDGIYFLILAVNIFASERCDVRLIVTDGAM